MKKVRLVTHNSVFHCDEAMATAILKAVYSSPDVEIIRTNNPKFYQQDSNDNDHYNIIYDIGFGELDHHQKGGNGARDNGVPYAAAGLVWKKYGNLAIKMIIINTMPDTIDSYSEEDINSIWANIDTALIQGIDAVDNGYSAPVAVTSNNPESITVKYFSISNIVSSLNTLAYDGGVTDNNKQYKNFMIAVDICIKTLVSMVRKFASVIYSNRELETLVKNREDKHILILEKYIPWIGYLTNPENDDCKDIWYVLFPSSRNNDEWNMQAVPVATGTYEQRHSVPKSWWGGNKETLPKITGVETASFCHQSNGFLTVAGNFEDIMKLAKIATEE